ncbi:MAG: hypothetical protein COW71_08215 [Ignavibacteriales bacterium CG18_big_fil_WC_8_21_14_2_50_31_20]|nr:MAG: hypothetical protein COW71_08215 [Ignavibacteriales bacterium CG18_big_fil_WC_8_21_14_2_50_31_20]
MKYIKAILFILSFTMAFVFFSCEKGTEPEQLKPGRRDYTWTADTLSSPMWHGSCIWGSSASDVWVVGGDGSSTDRIWHYDGKKWEHNTTPIYAGDCVFGFGENDVWIGGSEGSIWHYDGNNWSEEFKYTKDGSFYGLYILDIWGVDRNNLFAVGVDIYDNTERGFILKYDGSEWKEVYYADYNSMFYKIRSQNKSKSKYYIWEFKMSTPTGNDTTAILKYENNKTTEIYSKPIAKLLNSGTGMALINDNIYIGSGKNFYNIVDDKLINFFTFDDLNSFGAISAGRNSNDLILAMSDGFVHYNGKDIKYLFYLNNDNIHPTYGGVITDDTIFLLVGMFPTIVYKGVLNNNGG